MPSNGHDLAPRLSILILGPPVVTLDGKPLKVPRREQRAGLYFLAGHINPVSRAEICEVFWPKESEAAARRMLRVGLSRLRSDLQDQELLITEDDLVSLNPDRVYVDAHEYTRIVTPLLNSSELNNSGKLPDWCYSQLCKAMSVCRGYHVLQGFSLPNSAGFENWQVFTNQAFNFSREKIVERLADHCIAIGNLDEAMLWLGKALDTDPINTDLNYLMLDCLREKGRIKEALDYTNLLEDVYAASPQGEFPKTLLDFRERLLAEPKPQKSYETPWPGAETNAVPFIGRYELLNLLTQAYHRKGIVNVIGSSGSGKNRLVQEFYSRLEIKPRLVFCVGRPMMHSSPFSVLVDGLLASVTDREWKELPEHMKRELGPLFPTISLSETMPASQERVIRNLQEPMQPILSALHDLMVVLAAKKPIFFVLDIAKWCDEATITFLTYLNEKNYFKKFGLLVLLSRTEERNAALEVYLDRAILTQNLETIEVTPFSIEESEKLISTIMGREINGEVLTRIQRETGGNPFFLIETIRYLKEQQLLPIQSAENDYFPIPPIVRAMIQEKIRPLSPLAKEVLRSASVLGRRFLPESLEEMMTLSRPEMVDALEELIFASILVGESGLRSNAHYEFPHDQVREVVLEDLSPARKRLLHLKAVNALVKVKGEAPHWSTLFAYHYSMAGENAKAFDQWSKAGRYARLRCSRQDCLAAYQKGFELLPLLPVHENSKLIREFFSDWIDLSVETNDLERCDSISNKCLEIGEQNQDAELIGLGYSGLGQCAVVQNRMTEAVDLLMRANYYFTKADARSEMLETLATLGYIHVLKNDLASAQRCYDEGLRFVEQEDSGTILQPQVALEAQYSIFNSLIGRPGRAEEISSKAVNESLLINSPATKVRAFTANAHSLYYTGKYRKSIRAVDEVYLLAEKYHMHWWKAFLDLILARDYLGLGYLDECWHHVTLALDAKERVTLNQLESIAMTIKGDFYRLLGDLAKAETFYRQGSELTTVSFKWLENLYLLGLVLWQQGRRAESQVLIEDIVSRSSKDGWESLHLISRIFRNFVLADDQTDSSHKENYQTIVTDLKKRGYGGLWMHVEFDRIRYLFATGEGITAKSLLLELNQAASQAENRLLVIDSLAFMRRNIDLGVEERQWVRSRLEEQLMIVSAHALKPPAAGQFRKYRASLK